MILSLAIAVGYHNPPPLTESVMPPTRRHWVPVAFCAFLCLLALVGAITSAFFQGGTAMGWWMPAFFSFLPMCFFFVAAITTSLQQEILELRQQVEALQAERK
jgi:hypothetical protein